MARHLPQPFTGAETYLAAVHEELQQTNELLGQVLARLPRHLGAQAEPEQPSVEASAAVVEGAAATEPAPEPEPDKPSEDSDDVVEVREPDPPPAKPQAPRRSRVGRTRKQ